MDNIDTFVFSVGLIIFVAHFFTALFVRTKVPDVLPLIIIGIFIGPLSGMISPLDFGYIGPLLSTIALALLLFEGGSHLTLETLKTSLKDSVVLTLANFCLTVMIVTSITHYMMQIDILPAIFIGTVLGSISPAVVVPIVRMLNLSENTKSKLVIESALTDVLSIIFALGILKTFETGQKSLMEFIGTNLIATMAMSLLLGFGGAVIWSTILEKIRKFPNTIFTSLAFIFLLYGLSDILGYSGPISILVFGIVLANSKKIPINIIQNFGTDHLTEFTSIEKTLFSEVIFLVKTFFFIFLGISIQFENIKVLLLGIILTLVIYVGRLILSRFLIPKNISRNEAAMISFIIPKGLAAAVLAEVPMHMNLPNTLTATFIDIRSIVYMVILFSILLTSFLIYCQETGITKLFYKRFLSIFPEK